MTPASRNRAASSACPAGGGRRSLPGWSPVANREGELMVAFVFRPKRRRGGKLRVSPTWWMRYGPDSKNLKVRNLGVRDEQVARKRMTEFVRELEREADGIIAPKALRDGAAKPMTEHLADFIADLKALGRDRMYVYNSDRLNKRLLTECGWVRPADVTAESFGAWRSAGPKNKRNGHALAAKSVNEYLNHANALLNWMKR